MDEQNIAAEGVIGSEPAMDLQRNDMRRLSHALRNDEKDQIREMKEMWKEVAEEKN